MRDDTIRAMSPLILYFASGDSLYLGAGLLLIAIFGSTPFRRKRGPVVLSLATWLGLAMIAMASPPFSWWIDVSFAALLALWLFSKNQQHPAWAVIRRAAKAFLVVWLTLFPATELSRRRMKTIEGIRCDHLVVMGDSISAGIGNEILPWPALMQHQTGVVVRNLSRTGAGVAEAQLMAMEVHPNDDLILIEIGGNDLLSDVPAEKFSEGLEALLRRLARPSRIVLMFELPLLPNEVEYGQIQRRLAARYGVLLIPKHYFAAVFAGSGATSDGLHLSKTGVQRMAALAEQILSPVLLHPS
jgi:acyl-CoA thioesterase I